MVVIKEGGPDVKTAASRLDKLHRTLDSERERRDVLARNYILGRDLRGSVLSEIRREIRRVGDETDWDESREGGGGGGGRGRGGGEKYDEQDGFNRDDMIPHNNILSNMDKPASQSIVFTATNSGSNSHFTVPGDTDPTAYCLLDMDVYPRLHGWLLMASNDASQVWGSGFRV